jgi:hypothetical protein
MLGGEWVPVGGFAVAALGLIGSATFAVVKWAKRRFFSIDFDLSFPYLDLIHITEVSGGHTGFRISRVGLWVQIVVTNSGSESELINQLRAYEVGSSVRKTIGLVKNFHCGSDEAAVEGHLSLPLRIESHDAVRMWTVAEIDIPELLGKALGDLYGIDGIVLGDNSRRVLKKWKDGEKYVREHAKADAKVVGLVLLDFKFGEIKIRDPLIDVGPGENVKLHERLSRLKESFHEDLFREVAEGRLKFPPILATPFHSYAIELVLQNGRTLRKAAAIEDALWFMHPDRAFISRKRRHIKAVSIIKKRV